MTLEQLTIEFANWRKNRTSSTDPIPSTLWKYAAEVAEKSSPTEVACACKIAVSKLKKKMGHYSSTSSSKVTFKKIEPQLQSTYIELITPSGIQIRIY